MTIYIWHVTVQVGDSKETTNVEAVDYAQAVDIATAGGQYKLISCFCTGEAVR
jgi:hypothetical protein